MVIVLSDRAPLFGKGIMVEHLGRVKYLYGYVACNCAGAEK